MLKEHEKFRLMDKAKNHDFFAEVNWDDQPQNQECKIVKFTFPNGDKAFVERKHLNEMLFAIGTPEDQRKLIPTVETSVRWWETVLSVKAKKDIKRGENITFPIKLSIPASAEETIGVRNQNKIIVPIS